MSPIRTLVVDDEPLARRLLRELLADFPLLEVTGECANGEQALTALRSGEHDLVFLDVQMPDLTGVQVLQRLREAGVAPPFVVFATAYDHYAVQAFELHAVDYLLKPLDPARFAECVENVQQRLRPTQPSLPPPTAIAELTALLQAWAPAPTEPNFQDRFLIKHPERQFLVPAAQVYYLEATSSGVLLHTANQRHALRTPLGTLAERLDPAVFLRIHRSILVNIDHITEFKPWAHGEYVFRMANGLHVTSSRTYNAAVQSFLKRYA